MTREPQVPSAERREEVRALLQNIGGYPTGNIYSVLHTRPKLFWSFIVALDAQSAERTRAEVEGLTATLEDEQAAHIDTLRLLTNARAEVAEMEDAGILAVKKARAEVEKMREAAARTAEEEELTGDPPPGMSRNGIIAVLWRNRHKPKRGGLPTFIPERGS